MIDDIWIDCDEYKACACGGAIRPGRHTPTECEPLDTLGRSGQVYVTLRAAREYAAGTELGEEQARRELTELLLDARRRSEQRRAPYESWRFRRRSAGVEISALVSREGRLAVVVTVDARRKHAT